MDWKLGDLPLHPLFVHLTTVAVPVTALMAIVIALWPAARRRLGLAAPVIALVALISTPLASSSGKALEAQSEKSAAIERHAELGDTLIIAVLPLTLLVIVWWALHRWFPADAATTRPDGSSVARSHRAVPGWTRAARIVVPILLVVAGLAALIDVILIGHAGAVAVWTA